MSIPPVLLMGHGTLCLYCFRGQRTPTGAGSPCPTPVLTSVCDSGRVSCVGGGRGGVDAVSVTTSTLTVRRPSTNRRRRAAPSSSAAVQRRRPPSTAARRTTEPDGPFSDADPRRLPSNSHRSPPSINTCTSRSNGQTPPVRFAYSYASRL